MNWADALGSSSRMTRLLIHVEGETEEAFVNEVLASHLYGCGYTKVSARLVGNARQRDRRGGIRAWSAVRRDILHHMKEDAGCLSTTMVDFYALPQTGDRAWPGRAQAAQLAFADKAPVVENALLADICYDLGGGVDACRFVPFVMMHEFEGLLFSDAAKLAHGIGRIHLVSAYGMSRQCFLLMCMLRCSSISLFLLLPLSSPHLPLSVIPSQHRTSIHHSTFVEMQERKPSSSNI